MTEHIHITAGRTALRTLLIAVVLTASVAGTVGMAAAEPIDGKGNDVLTARFTDSSVVADGIGWTGTKAIDGKGNDVIIERFPINNVTFFSAGMVVEQGSSNAGFVDGLSVSDLASVVLAWSQDMDPY